MPYTDAKPEPRRSVTREMDVLSVRSISHPRDVSDFIRAMYEATSKAGYEDLVLDFQEVTKVFPNACVPIAAVIDHYRRTGIGLEVRNASHFLEVTHMTQPMEPSIEALALIPDPTSRVWLISDEQGISNLIDRYVETLSHRVECQLGVIEAFEWCLNEIMDNVLQHSGINRGFAMVQIHPETHRVAVCVADIGIGILNSLIHSIYSPRTAVDAITLAVREGVTRDSSIGQGNGLWGLLEIVSANAGRLIVTSGAGSVTYVKKANVDVFDRLPFVDRKYQGAIVDFQLDTCAPIDLPKALGGHQPVNLRLEQFETDLGDHLIEIKQHSHGTGTRRAGEQLRNLVINIVNQGSTRVTLDFSGIGVISSSFADELVGKLVARYGLFTYQQVINLKGMTDTVQTILTRSVAQRMIQSFKEPPPEQASDRAGS